MKISAEASPNVATEHGMAWSSDIFALHKVPKKGNVDEEYHHAMELVNLEACKRQAPGAKVEERVSTNISSMESSVAENSTKQSVHAQLSVPSAPVQAEVSFQTPSSSVTPNLYVYDHRHPQQDVQVEYVVRCQAKRSSLSCNTWTCFTSFLSPPGLNEFHTVGSVYPDDPVKPVTHMCILLVRGSAFFLLHFRHLSNSCYLCYKKALRMAVELVPDNKAIALQVDWRGCPDLRRKLEKESRRCILCSHMITLLTARPKVSGLNPEMHQALKAFQRIVAQRSAPTFVVSHPNDT